MPRKANRKPENTGPLYETRVVKKIEDRLNSSHLSQKEIATRAGYPNPNIITMIKQGMSRVPLDRAALLANVLEVDPAEFFELTMEQQYPEVDVNPVHTIFKGVMPTEDEIEMLRIIREVKGPSPKSYRHQGADEKKAKEAQMEAFRKAVEKAFSKS